MRATGAGVAPIDGAESGIRFATGRDCDPQNRLIEGLVSLTQTQGFAWPAVLPNLPSPNLPS
jgi:hypothetical protein